MVFRILQLHAFLLRHALLLVLHALLPLHLLLKLHTKVSVQRFLPRLLLRLQWQQILLHMWLLQCHLLLRSLLLPMGWHVLRPEGNSTIRHVTHTSAELQPLGFIGDVAVFIVKSARFHLLLTNPQQVRLVPLPPVLRLTSFHQFLPHSLDLPRYHQLHLFSVLLQLPGRTIKLQRHSVSTMLRRRLLPLPRVRCLAKSRMLETHLTALLPLSLRLNFATPRGLLWLLSKML